MDSGLLGASDGWGYSAVVPKAPSSPTVTLSGGGIFLFSTVTAEELSVPMLLQTQLIFECALPEVARLLTVEEKTAYNMAQEGRLGFHIRGQWRFTRVDIDRWMEQQKAASRNEVRR